MNLPSILKWRLDEYIPEKGVRKATVKEDGKAMESLQATDHQVDL